MTGLTKNPGDVTLREALARRRGRGSCGSRMGVALGEMSRMALASSL